VAERPRSVGAGCCTVRSGRIGKHSLPSCYGWRRAKPRLLDPLAGPPSKMGPAMPVPPTAKFFVVPETSLVTRNEARLRQR
jgi:hypothetical protein